MNDGKVATYIPQLARVDPKVLADGGIRVETPLYCSCGASRSVPLMGSVPRTATVALHSAFNQFRRPSTMRSPPPNSVNSLSLLSRIIREVVSGADAVHRYVGQEPSGRLFNDICLDSNSHFPHFNSRFRFRQTPQSHGQFGGNHHHRVDQKQVEYGRSIRLCMKSS